MRPYIEELFLRRIASRYSSALSSKEFRPARSALPTPRRAAPPDHRTKGDARELQTARELFTPRAKRNVARILCNLAIVRVPRECVSSSISLSSSFRRGETPVSLN